MQNSVLQCKKY